MTTYTVNFSNQTDKTWTFCIYQVLPDSVGLDSVAWKQTTIPYSGYSGVQWNVQYLAGLANYKQIGGKGVYTASQILPTDLGQQWNCVFQEGVQQLVSVGSTTEGQLLISNNSGFFANLAIGMDGDIALVQNQVCGNMNAQFSVKPKYYVALFDNLTKGQIISGDTILAPIEIDFAGGETTKNYTAYMEGQNIVLSETSAS